MMQDVERKPGNSLLCTKAELPEIMRRLERQRLDAIKDVSVFFLGDIDIRLEPTKYVTGWGVEATLTVNGETVRHYMTAGLCFLELNLLVLEKIIELRR